MADFTSNVALSAIEGPIPRSNARMTRVTAIDCAVLAVLVFLSRWIFRSHYLYDIDSVNFALALHRFDPSAYQPHPPGYFLYVLLGRVAKLIVTDDNASLVAISIAFSCATAAVIYILTTLWFGRIPGRFAAAIFIFSPLTWFHGTVALTYVVEMFFSAVVGLFCWRIYSGNHRYIAPAAAVIGIATGFRPSSILFLTPLFFFSCKRASRNQCVAGVATLFLTLIAWVIPMISASGGLTTYMGAMFSLWHFAAGKQTIFNSSPLISLARALTILGILILCFGSSLAVLTAVRRPSQDLSEEKRFTAIWIGPALLFFVFIFLRFVNSGYLLVICGPMFPWIGLRVSDWYQRGNWTTTAKLTAIGVGAALNVAIFLTAPLYCSYREVRRFETQLSGILADLPVMQSRETALIVGFDSHFLGYRHAGYYLPDFSTVQFPEVRLASGIRAFAMRGRDTEVVDRIHASGFRSFVLFPLPQGDNNYAAYANDVHRRFPKGTLKTTVIDGVEYWSGPIESLPLLFPVTGRIDPVYTDVHSKE